MSNLPPKPAHYDVGGWIKWLEAHVDHLMSIVPQPAESPSAITEPAPEATGAEDVDIAGESAEPPKG